ncbi:DUF6022 family protein [Pseudalkalibacillus decolorationis]|uniref:DUF6022 family protein n=1 Tax=Pseudalkalibacillus decolorationis TaxID=163879 RepID=UPI00214835BB|nr:DUF6022 family protein [Pseudalkalibacillus decolorationis]
MNSLKEVLSQNQEITIHTLANYMNQYTRNNWKSVLQEHQSEFQDAFEKSGEFAYGVFGRKLFGPLIKEIEHEGIVLESDHLASSVEYWGPPEERERCMWHVCKHADGTPMGSLVTRVFHDHTQFRIPRSPEIIALEKTERSEIVEALSHASSRITKYNEFTGTFLTEKIDNDEQGDHGWEYSVEVGLGDCLETDNPEMTEGMMDHALSLWGRNNWELTSVVPYQGRLITFFKRPVIGRK